jgi:hypothetical protein
VNTKTATTILPVVKEIAFAYLADVDNLPRWATEFARELKVVDGKHKVVNGLGEFFFEIRSDESTGVIDMLAGPSEEEMALFPARVGALPGEASAFTFTMFQAPGTSDELFEGQYESLLRELENVKHELEGLSKDPGAFGTRA